MSLYHIDTIKHLSQLHGLFSLLRAKFLLENGSWAESPLKAVSLDYRAGSLAGVWDQCLCVPGAGQAHSAQPSRPATMPFYDLPFEGKPPFPAAHKRFLETFTIHSKCRWLRTSSSGILLWGFQLNNQHLTLMAKEFFLCLLLQNASPKNVFLC